MRIISQHGEYDVPYDKCALWMKYPENIIYAAPIGETDTLFQMAKYSTQEKTERAMRELHIYYEDNLKAIFTFPAEDEL